MKSKVTVVASEFVQKHYEKSTSESFVCKVMMFDPDTNEVDDVGTLRVPKALTNPAILTEDGQKIRKGDYLIDFKADRKYSDDGIGGRLCCFEAVQAAVKTAPQQQPAAPKQ